MKLILILCFILVATFCSDAEDLIQPEGETRWTGFRGNQGISHTDAINLPLTWSETENIRWKIDLSGYGQSSPVVWDGRVYVTSSEGSMKETLIAQAIDLTTGDIIWTKRFNSSFMTDRLDMAAQAAPTPVVDAENVYAFFESGDLFAISHQGEKLWHRAFTEEYGAFMGNHEIGSSITQTDDAIILLIDHDGPSYLVSLSKRDGANLWKRDREKRVSWTSPVVSKNKNSTKIIISSNGIVEAYNSKTGEQIWYVEGVKKNTVSSPTITDKLVIVGSSQKGETLAIERGGVGNVTESHIHWKADIASSFGSPLVHSGRVYFVNKVGVLSCLNLDTGEQLWTIRIGSPTWASPIAAGNYLYFFGKDGDTTVLHFPSKQLLVSKTDILPSMNINFIATESRVYGVAAVNGFFLIRTGKRLICVGKP